MPDESALIELLRKVDAFAGGDAAGLKALAGGFRKRNLGSGEWIVREREKGGEMFLLLEGECEVLAAGKRIGKIEPGQVFGEIAALTGGSRMASIRSARECVVLAMDQRDFQRVLHASPELSASVCLSLAKYMA